MLVEPNSPSFCGRAGVHFCLGNCVEMLKFMPPRPGPTLRRAIVIACSSAAFAMTMATSGTALGQWEADRATARNLAAEGNAALNIGDYTTAEDRFRRADALVHAPTLVVDHAKALIGLHRYVEAQERLELVIREGVADNVPWVWKRAVQDAKQLVEDVKPKIAWVTISVTGSSNPDVSVDGVQVPVAALGVRRATDPGPHRIKAEAPGFLKKEIIMPVSEGSERAVTLELEPDPAAQQAAKSPPAKPKPAPARPSNDTKDTKSGSLFSSSNVGYITLGIGGAGLIVGAVTGIMFLGKHSELKDKCPDKDHCAAPQSSIDQYNTYAVISPIAFGVGIVSSTVGVILLLNDSSESATPKQTSSTFIKPYFGLDRLGVEGTF